MFSWIKSIFTIIIVISLFMAALFWNPEEDRVQNEHELFGEPVYVAACGDTVRVRKNDTDDYDIYLCYCDPDTGCVQEYELMGTYPSESVYEGISHTVTFYQNTHKW